jgi:hypothetical protein
MSPQRTPPQTSEDRALRLMEADRQGEHDTTHRACEMRVCGDVKQRSET